MKRFNKYVMRLEIAFKLIFSGKLNIIVNNISTRINSEKLAIGFERKATKLFKSPNSKISFSIRLLEDSDINTLNENYRHERLVKENIKSCYIAYDSNNVNCYRQWLMSFSENEKIKKYFGNLFPELQNKEALIEGVFTKPNYRGLGIMPRAMSLISEKGFEEGYDRIIVFVDILNIPSLKGCLRSGFTPYCIRKEKWFLFIRYISFENITLEINDKLEELSK